MSKRQLAIKARMPYQTLLSAFRRQSEGLSIEYKLKIAEVLEVNLSDLYGDSNLYLNYSKPVKPVVNTSVSRIMGCLYYNCGNCGNQLRSFAKFCDQCGKPVDLEAIKEFEKGSVAI